MIVITVLKCLLYGRNRTRHDRELQSFPRFSSRISLSEGRGRSLIVPSEGVGALALQGLL